VKLNAGKTYYKVIHKVSLQVNKYIIKKIKNKKLPIELETFLLTLPEKRKNKAIMRSCLTYLIYKNLGGKKDIKSLLPILSISEFSNYYAYLDNWILDNKNQCNNDIENVKKIIISSEIFREMCQECIEESNLSNPIKRELSKKLLDASIKSYSGQFQDIELTIKKINSFKSDNDFFKYYENKSRLASGYFYGLSFEIGAIILNKSIKNKVNQLGTDFGTALHISNDLGDFGLFYKTENSFKIYQDQLSDLVNQRLTLPIYLTMKYGNNEEISALNKIIKTFSNKAKINASKAIVSSGSFYRIMNLLTNYEKNLRTKTKETLPKNEYREMIESVLSAITTNKYLKDLKNIKIKKIEIKEELVLVDKNDKIIGFENSKMVHEKGKLHRVASVLIFNSKGELLIQKISSLNTLFGGLWGNACYNHSIKDKKTLASIKKSLKEDLGINTQLKKMFSFQYKIKVSEKIIENELNHVFIGQSDSQPEINIKKIEDYKWITMEKLKKDLKENPKKYVWWFKIILNHNFFKNKNIN
jgi:isopentenyl-diphosphate Delta-isomerase